tara:strand:- start:199 stop:1368 length:1170 start_codon:yes stop_codon:yes gene_type:complete
MRTQVLIIGGGPSGLLLSQLLHLSGIDCITLEKHSKQHVLSRIRAGVLEQGTVDLLKKAGVHKRLEKEGFKHNGIFLSAKNNSFRIDFKKLVKKSVTVYGQTEVTTDLYKAREKSNGIIFNYVKNVIPYDINTNKPYVTFNHNGVEKKVFCDFIAGCDGFHGVSRQAIPKKELKIYERIYPFGWLGVLSETPPVNDELIYANHETGFALASMRNRNLSRYYIQTSIKDKIEQWNDKKFWLELKKRLPFEASKNLITGPSIEKSIAPLRSFVAEPMKYGSLFLVGDAAHIVPPTGAKGLNLAFSDVHYLYESFKNYYKNDDKNAINAYSDMALTRVWKAIRFSWWMTITLHKFPGQSSFDQRIQETELEYLKNSVYSQRALAENYVGLPF